MLATQATKEAKPREPSFFSKYGRHFAMTLVGAVATLGATAVVENWEVLVSTLNSVETEDPPTGAQGSIVVSFEWNGEAFSLFAFGGWGTPDEHPDVFLSEGEQEKLGLETEDPDGYELIAVIVRRAISVSRP